MGSIEVKDVTSDEILLKSIQGDIQLDGIIDGLSVTAETGGEGRVEYFPIFSKFNRIVLFDF